MQLWVQRFGRFSAMKMLFWVRWHSTKWHAFGLRVRMRARNVTHAIVNIKRYFNNSVSAKRADVFVYLNPMLTSPFKYVRIRTTSASDYYHPAESDRAREANTENGEYCSVSSERDKSGDCRKKMRRLYNIYLAVSATRWNIFLSSSIWEYVGFYCANLIAVHNEPELCVRQGNVLQM